jgi:hypothetical protein
MHVETFTPEQAELLARGYPHLVLLEEGHPHDAAPGKAAAEVHDANDPVYGVRWPQNTALCYVLGFVPEHGSPTGKRAKIEPRQPTVEEARAICAHLMLDLKFAYPFHVSGAIYILEAALGTEPILDALIAAYEALAARAPCAADAPKYMLRDASEALGFLLHRAPAVAAAPARARLQALLQQVGARDVPAFDALKLVLGGPSALAESSYTWIPPTSWLFSDDPAFVEKAIRTAKGAVDVDVQAVWRGGEAVLGLLAKYVKKVPRAGVPGAVEALGMFRTPAVVPLLELLAVKKGGEAAQAWLDEHAASLGPTAGGRSAPAQAALAQTKGAPAVSQRAAAKSKKPTARVIEAAFDELTDTLVAELTQTRGDSAAEEAALQSAADRYIEIRGWSDTSGAAYLTHFFCADGVGLAKARPSAWSRLSPTPQEHERWVAILEEQAR